jgi:hypothetical protein
MSGIAMFSKYFLIPLAVNIAIVAIFFSYYSKIPSDSGAGFMIIFSSIPALFVSWLTPIIIDVYSDRYRRSVLSFFGLQVLVSGVSFVFFNSFMEVSAFVSTILAPVFAAGFVFTLIFAFYHAIKGKTSDLT